MKLIIGWLLVGVFLCSIALYANTYNRYDPYKLNYNRIGINLPISKNKTLELAKYPLGERYLAEHLMEEFINNGYEVKIFAIEDVLLSTNYKAGFEVYMRSYPELKIQDYHSVFDEDKIAVLFETIPYKLEQVKNADIIFTGSIKRNNELKKMGLNSYFLPQFTKLDHFYPAYKEEYKSKILYVANQWPDSEMRKTVRYAINNGIDIDIYGANWGEKLDEKSKHLLKADQISNDDLKYYYSSADIVLNDTREDMIEEGFISNRIFDVTACGGFIISDYIEGIEEIYGDAIPMYKKEEEFVKLIKYYLEHEEERREKALKAHEITKKYFSSDKVVAKMLEIMKGYALEKNLM